MQTPKRYLFYFTENYIQFGGTKKIMTKYIKFYEYKNFLLEILPRDCVEIIEKYYNNLCMSEVIKQVINIPLFALRGNGDFYNKPKKYIYEMIKQQKIKYENDKMIYICRYFMYNQIYFSPNLGIRRDSIVYNMIRKLILSNMKFNLCKYYYIQLFFKSL